MKDIREMTDEELKSLSESELNNFINETMIEFMSVFTKATRHLSELEEIGKKVDIDSDLAQDIDKMIGFVKPKLVQDIIDVQDILSDLRRTEYRLLKKTDSDRINKSYSQTMSQNANDIREEIQISRDERYDEIIAEAEKELGPIESPMDRLKR